MKLRIFRRFIFRSYLSRVKLSPEVSQDGGSVFAAGLPVADDDERTPLVGGEKLVGVDNLV
jgi:hypothetical protein